jgi:hypothetical protein
MLIPLSLCDNLIVQIESLTGMVIVTSRAIIMWRATPNMILTWSMPEKIYAISQQSIRDVDPASELLIVQILLLIPAAGQRSEMQA